MLMLETNLSRFDETALREMLADLPSSWSKRVTRKKPFKARLQSAVGYSLLRSILQSNYDVYDLPAIAVDEYGKPYFENSDLFFSISHCDAAVACIVEDHPVAVDVQEILNPKSERFRQRLGAQELDDRALTVLWTQKEASAKLDGRGLRIPLTELPLKEHILKTTDYGTFIVTIACVCFTR